MSVLKSLLNVFGKGKENDYIKGKDGKFLGSRPNPLDLPNSSHFSNPTQLSDLGAATSPWKYLQLLLS